MVVYWDLVAAWNFALDYILLLCTLRLAGQSVHRRRIAASAALGAAYAVAALKYPQLVWALLLVALLMCRVAFGPTPRLLRLSLLHLLLSCALGGLVLLLGSVGGSMARLARGVVFSELPWGVFCAALGASYLLLTLIFRGVAKRDAADFVRVCVRVGDKHVTLRLLRDTGNALTDPLTGEGVPVIEEAALAPLLGNVPFTALRVGTVGGDGTLRAFRCDALEADGRNLGARLIAVTPEPFSGGCQGVWFAEETEEKQHDLAKLAG